MNKACLSIVLALATLLGGRHTIAPRTAIHRTFARSPSRCRRHGDELLFALQQWLSLNDRSIASPGIFHSKKHPQPEAAPFAADHELAIFDMLLQLSFAHDEAFAVTAATRA